MFEFRSLIDYQSIPASGRSFRDCLLCQLSERLFQVPGIFN